MVSKISLTISRRSSISTVTTRAVMILPKAIDTPPCTVMLTSSQGQGGQEVGRQRKATVGVQPLIPPELAHWPRYIIAQEVHHHLGGRSGALGGVVWSGESIRPRG